MPDEWRRVAFREVCEHSSFGPRFSSEEYSAAGNVACLRVTDIDWNGRINFATMPLAQLDVARFRNHILQRDDLVITRTGAYLGKAAVFTSFRLPVLPGAFSIRFRLKRDIADPLFLRYFFNSSEGQDAIQSIATGSAQPNLNIPNLHSLTIPVPPLAEQKAIVGVLKVLDDKIELNRRMNETLEAIAQALFKSWFADATQNGLPEGWSEAPLDKVAKFLNGLALQKFPPDGGDSLPVIKISQLRAGNTEGADRATANLSSEYVIEDGDVLFSWSGSLEIVIWCGGPGALNQHLFKVTSDKYPKWFYYLWTKYHLSDFQAIASAKATTMGHIQRHHLSEAGVAVPPDENLERMETTIAPLIEKIIANKIESRTLAALRNALLPKLLSGEVTVSKTIPTGE